ncbi:hypothetical protein PAECIP111894_00197 [Paenibacillus pseudetheri]|uniref:Uncharacterized protein n=1 Tax=Paenibacillus pseudetheri TaxID=2897682 RepID=A0ABM9B7B3_9BACL|nr:hypothetical protein PAECIP111894_00197 [Paenibacillus pseudetheri]
MKRVTEALNDCQVALCVVRGGSFQLTLLQEETTGDESTIVAQAKSFTVMGRDEAIRLRDLLNNALIVD